MLGPDGKAILGPDGKRILGPDGKPILGPEDDTGEFPAFCISKFAEIKVHKKDWSF